MSGSTDSNFYTTGFLSGDIKNPIHDEEKLGQETDPLALDVPDHELTRIIDKRIRDYHDYYSKNYDLFERRKKNETYLFGRQIAELEKEGQLKDYSARNLDNVLYEIERTIKPLAMSQLPDLLVTPGSNTDSSKMIANLLTTAVDSDIKKRQNRKVLAMTFKHRSVYFVGIMKVRWDPSLAGGNGDYVFEYLHPDTVDFDYTCNSADADAMSWISHLVPMTIEKVIMQFPKAKEKFYEQLRKDGMLGKEEFEPSWTAMATPIDVREVWFTDYETAEDGKWKRVEGVCWKYKDVILLKMKNPYFDYTGENQLFVYDNPQLASSKRPLSVDEMQSSMMTGIFPQYLKQEQVYHNYFEMPKKPFFFVVYDQWGKQPLDETTHLEQNIRNQDTLDKRARQIEETLNHRGHHVWSKLGGFKPSDIQKMDHNNPDEDYLVDGIPQQVHEFVPAERPGEAEFKDIDRTQNRMYALSSSTAIRGQLQTDVATTNQIGREANYTVMDDMVEETINAASEWMAGWAMQMIKTRYTQEHFRKLLGRKGETIFLTLHQNMIEDGMSVLIKSSGTDKLKRQNQAQNEAKMQMIDILSYMEDMDKPDPEGRAARLITQKVDMPLYLAEFVETGPTATAELAGKLAQLTAQGMNQPMPGQGGQQPPANPQQPNPGNTQVIAASPQPGVAASPQ